MKVKLSDLYDIGSSKRVFQSEWRKSGVPFYRAREIAKLSDDDFVDNELFIDEELYSEYIEKYGKPEAGDVMVTGVGTLGVCYVVKPEDRFYFKDGNILWFRQKAKDKILPEYFVKAFDSKEVKDFIDKNSSGTTVGTFTIQTAKKMEISLPSLDEQKEIIDKVTRIELIIKQRKQELQLLDNLIKARFVEMFGDPNDTKRVSDSRHKIGELCDVTKLAGFEFTEYINYQDSGEIIMLRGLNCKQGKLVLDNVKYIDRETSNKLPRSRLYVGDILMTYAGTIGDVAMVDEDDKYHLAPNVAKISIVAKDMLNPTFLVHLFMYSHDYIMTFASQVAQASINMQKIRDFEYIIPSMEEQIEFEQFAKQVDKSKVAVQKALTEAQLLFDSLMQQYFG